MSGTRTGKTAAYPPGPSDLGVTTLSGLAVDSTRTLAMAPLITWSGGGPTGAFMAAGKAAGGVPGANDLGVTGLGGLSVDGTNTLAANGGTTFGGSTASKVG